MAKVHERIFAGLGALFFLLSACALSIYVIFQVTNGDEANKPATTATAQCEQTSVPAGTEAVPEVATTDAVTALQTTDITVGSGETAAVGDCLQMKYVGSLASTGEVFDGNFDKETALQFQLGQGQVIPGWDQGLVGMKVGGVRKLVIPADLAYKSTGVCKTYNQSDSTKCDAYSIPPDATLVFTVKLVTIKK